MRSRLPVPLAHWPRDPEDFESASERLGGQLTMAIGEKVEREIRDLDGVVRRRLAPSFVEWWIEFESDDVRSTAEVAGPTNKSIREFLTALARISAQAWAKEARSAKAVIDP